MLNRILRHGREKATQAPAIRAVAAKRRWTIFGRMVPCFWATSFLFSGPVARQQAARARTRGEGFGRSEQRGREILGIARRNGFKILASMRQPGVV